MSLWFTPLGWVLAIVLVFLQGGVFVTIVTSFATNPELTLDVGPLQAFYGQSVFVPLALMFVCLPLSMRTFAEERRRGTIDNLLSAPVGASSVVLGKYIAIVVSFIIMWLPSTLFPLLLRHVVDVEWPVVLTSYLGIVGLGVTVLSVGLLCSVITQSQFMALALSSTLLLALLLLGTVEFVGGDGWLKSLCAHVSIQSQLAEMSQGIVATSRLVFDITLSALAIYLATRVVDSWRWS